jgi:hypothetical protein
MLAAYKINPSLYLKCCINHQANHVFILYQIAPALVSFPEFILAVSKSLMFGL